MPNYIPNFSPIGPAVVPLLRLQYWRFSKIAQLWHVPRALGDPGALYFAHRTTFTSKVHAIKTTASQSDVPSQSYKRSTGVATAGRPAGRSYLDFSLNLSKNKLRSLRSLACNHLRTGNHVLIYILEAFQVHKYITFLDWTGLVQSLPVRPGLDWIRIAAFGSGLVWTPSNQSISYSGRCVYELFMVQFLPP